MKIEEKALEVYPIEEFVSYKIDGVIDKNETKRKCFIEGAKWMKEQIMKEAITTEVKEVADVRFPHEKNIVDKVFGAGNLEYWEYNEAKALVSLAKEELLKDIKLKKNDFEKEDKNLKMLLDAIDYFFYKRMGLTINH